MKYMKLRNLGILFFTLGAGILWYLHGFMTVVGIFFICWGFNCQIADVVGVFKEENQGG